MIKLILLASGKSYHATRWANELSKRGFEVTYLTIHKIVRPLNSNIEQIYVGGNGKFSYLLAIPRIRKIIKRIKPDILHSHTAGGYGYMGLFSGFKPWIVSIYGQDIYSMPHKSFFHKIGIKQILKGASCLLSTSSSMAKETIKTYPSLNLPFLTPFGVNISLFQKKIEQKEICDIVKIGIVKKLETVYGIDILIQAFERLYKEIQTKVELHIVGQGTELSFLQNLMKGSDCAESIVFYGAIPNSEVPRFLETIDIFVVPSRSESFGVAAVEASSMELPVIVSNVGGLPEVIEHGKTGLVVPSEDPISLCIAMRKLVSDSNLRIELGKAGRIKVEQEYDWNKNVENVINIYKSLLKK